MESLFGVARISRFGRVKNQFLICGLAFAAILTTFSSSAQIMRKDTTDGRSELAVMQALLVGVRQLRQAIGHMAAVNGRMQVWRAYSSLRGDGSLNMDQTAAVAA
jgi:hypothetical protein